jgi:fibronectin-binding autotransporter adhesin
MATRQTIHVLKNSDIIARPLPSTITKGEPIVNLADGIMLLSGVTQSTSGWTQSGPSGLQPNYFEVGSNLYDLKLRNKIASYNGLTNLSGKFLSGTTSGFVLANISDIISSSDIYVTGGTYSTGTATFTNNTGGTFNVTGFKTSDLVVTGGTYNSGTGVATYTNNTGGTFTVSGFKTSDLVVTGGTYNAGTAVFTNNTGGTFNVTGFSTGDTFTTGFTYTAAQNKLSILRNQGLPSLDVFVNSVSGLTVSDLTTNRLVYTTTAGKLITGTASFDGTNMVLPTGGNLTVGTGGLVVGSGGSAGTAGTGDLIVNGNLTVFGGSVSAFTSQLYVEDPNVIFNYNPTGSSIATSVGAGVAIQDGNGITSGNVTFEIRNLNTFTGLTGSQIPSITEYSGTTGFGNRGWVTQLNDIIIRSTDPTIPNGVRVLTEFDILDGGTF